MKKIVTLLLLTAILSACSISNRSTIKSTTTHGVNGQVIMTETEQTLTSNEFIQSQKVSADIAIANATGKCWDTQAVINKSSSMQIPAGLSAGDLAIFMMANALVESNKAITAANKPDTQPCTNMGTNSNDVAIAQEKGKTERSKARMSIIPTALGIVGGLAYGINGQNTTAEIATAGLSAIAGSAGNRTVINGDGNRAITSSQEADNGATITESGNYDEAGGIGTKDADVQLTASNDVEGSTEVFDAASCTVQGYTVREAFEDEIADPTSLLFDVNGVTSVCSTNDGNIVTI